MMVTNPTQVQWGELLTNCLDCVDDLAHINRYPYNGQRVASGQQLVGYLRSGVARVWLLQEEKKIIGFINYGQVIRCQNNAFGMVIGRQFAGQGHGKRALKQFLERKTEFGIREINGYCNRNNQAIIAIMEQCGMHRDVGFVDPHDGEAIRFVLAPDMAEQRSKPGEG